MRGALILALLLGGCGGSESVPADGGFFEQNLSSDLDLLFMIDDSSNMTTVQQNLVANFPVLIDRLRASDNGLPNLHIGVTTSSMGAGAFTQSVPGCMYDNGGNLVYQVRAATDPVCSSARITGPQHYIEALANESQKNYAGDISDVFRCIAQVGASGCGFEHQLAAVRAALGDPAMGLAPPAGNQGFLRDSALLAVVLVTDEDDCSAPPDSLLFDPGQNALSDPLGPLASFRCTEFGITCDGLGANNGRIPRTAGGPYANCRSNDALAQIDPQHALMPAQFFIDYFQRIKARPGQVIAAALAAPAEPFAVSVDLQTQFPKLNASCSNGQNGTFGDPPVRLKQVMSSFGALGLISPLCQSSYQDTMHVIGALIRGSLRNCLEGSLPVPPPAPGAVVDPTSVSCTVDSIPPCDPAGQPSGTCWALLGEAECATGIRAAVCRNGFAPTDPAQPSPPGPTRRPRAPAW